MRHALSHGLHYAAVIAICLGAAGPMARARWVYAAPRLGVAVWQALLLSLVTSVVGLLWAIGLAPYRAGEVTALVRLGEDLAHGRPVPLSTAQVTTVAAGLLVAAALAWTTARCVVATARVRLRQRSALALVGEVLPGAPGVTVLEHPVITAYCLPGRRPEIVVSTGALRALTSRQLDAVLAHERAHLTQRHDLALLPFAALRTMLAAAPLVVRMHSAVATLIEMCADDHAVRRTDRHCVRDAIALFALGGAAPPPAGALGAAFGVAERLNRLERPPSMLSVRAVAVVAGLVLLTATTPLSLLALP
jgi:Zn-dependent protease with chaperone function